MTEETLLQVNDEAATPHDVDACIDEPCRACRARNLLRKQTMTTYSLANGDLIGGEFAFVTERDGWFDDLDERTEIVEEVWVLQASRIIVLPKCSQCDEPAAFWGLCEPHAREDDPTAFDDRTEFDISGMAQEELHGG